MGTALVLIDFQNDYFPGGRMELVSMESAVVNAARVLSAFREASLPLLHVQHVSMRPGATFFLPDTKGVEIHASVSPEDHEIVLRKHFPNAFRDTELWSHLQSRSITKLAICGAMSHMCIDATTRAAFDLGLQCTVLEDACATRDLEFRGRTIPAADVHGAFMAALSVPYAAIVSTQVCLGQLRGEADAKTAS